MWTNLLKQIKEKNYYQNLMDFLDKEYEKNVVFPAKPQLFSCFSLCEENNLKVVIIGQDPYHEINQANGLAFSVNEGIKLPPSLKNIYKELEIEYNVKINQNGDLSYLAKQGVLLLNKYLSVVEGKPLSHKIKEYDQLFLDIINYINNINRPIVFMLWGGEAKKLEKLITNPNFLIIKATHPSPLGANKGGWFNSNIFKRCNEFLILNKTIPISWINKV